MKILILGDIYGSVATNTIVKHLGALKQRVNADLTIANGENVSTNGKSMTFKDYKTLKSAGVDYFTMGNHTFKIKEIHEYIDSADMVKPANFQHDLPGADYKIFEIKGKKILLFNLLGKAFMYNQKLDNPFHVADQILDNLEYDIGILDFHAEATSEKVVLGNYLKDKLSIFYGTHTHVATADERIIGKMAYVTDVGFTGILNSAIGANFKEVEHTLVNESPAMFVEATEGSVRINAILVTIDDKTNAATAIERIIIDD
ncbi:MAG: metallophosphoesterase [Tenericutes bacterium]|nr:MAG: metallophosphoesterase [Mycoplasmatota bacterium]